MKRRAQADVVGGVMFMLILIVASLSLFSVLGYYFAGQSAYNSVIAFSSAFNKQNMSVSFVQALPPSAQSGIIVANYGEPVQIIYLVEEQPNGSLKFIPASIYLQHGQVAEFLTNDPYSGVMTSYGGLFLANYSEPLIPVSIIAINTSAPSRLEYVTPGTYTIIAPYSVKWFVNATYIHAGQTITLYINGPTSVTAVPVNSHP